MVPGPGIALVANCTGPETEAGLVAVPLPQGEDVLCCAGEGVTAIRVPTVACGRSLASDPMLYRCGDGRRSKRSLEPALASTLTGGAGMLGLAWPPAEIAGALAAHGLLGLEVVKMWP